MFSIYALTISGGYSPTLGNAAHFSDWCGCCCTVRDGAKFAGPGLTVASEAKTAVFLFEITRRDSARATEAFHVAHLTYLAFRVVSNLHGQAETGELALATCCKMGVKRLGPGLLAHKKGLDDGLGQSLIQALYADSANALGVRSCPQGSMSPSWGHVKRARWECRPRLELFV